MTDPFIHYSLQLRQIFMLNLYLWFVLKILNPFYPDRMLGVLSNEVTW